MRNDATTRREARIIALLFCCLGLFLLASIAVAARIYLKFRANDGQPVTFSVEAYRHFLCGLWYTFFVALPALSAALLIGGYKIWRFLAHAPEPVEREIA